MCEEYVEAGASFTFGEIKGFKRNIFIKEEELEVIRNRYNNTDIFISPYTYDEEDQNDSNLYGPFYLDLDVDLQDGQDYYFVRKDLVHVLSSLEFIYGVPLEYIQIYFSGNKGFHVMIDPKVFGLEKCKNLNEKYKKIAEDLQNSTLYKSIDLRIYDKKRLFRAVNSKNSKTGLYKVLVDYDKIKEFDFEQMKEYAKTVKEVLITTPKTILKAKLHFEKIINKTEDKVHKIGNSDIVFKTMLPCITQIINEGVSEGNRNNTTVVLSSALFQMGKSHEEVEKIILDWNNEKNNPKLSDFEIKRTVNSAYDETLRGFRFGCSSISDLGFCIEGDCKFKKGR